MAIFLPRKADNFTAISLSLTLNMTILDSNPSKFPAKFLPPHKTCCLFRNGPQFAQVVVFKSNSKLVKVTAVHIIVIVFIT